MKKLLVLLMAAFMMVAFAACTDGNSNNNENNGGTGAGMYQMKIIVGDRELIADMYDNATSRAIKERLPMELDMLDLYGREMCYRFDDALPTGNLVSTGYELGEIAYWAPRHSFVILYEQNGEHFQRQILGKVKEGYEIFDGIGDVKVRFELVDDSESAVPPEANDEETTNPPADDNGEEVTPPTTGNENEEVTTPPTTDEGNEEQQPPVTGGDDNNSDNEQLPEETPTGDYRVRITFGNTVLYATFYDNDTTRALRELMPLELPMMDLYGREMCYRFPDALPTDDAHSRGYEVGEIVYYPPMHSFVIMYKQNGEHFQMQSIGRIESGIEVFDGIGNISVKIEIVD